MSRASQRELHAVAAGVVHGEDLGRLLESNAGDPARRERLHIVTPPGH
jgi:hypothetical protein